MREERDSRDAQDGRRFEVRSSRFSELRVAPVTHVLLVSFSVRERRFMCKRGVGDLSKERAIKSDRVHASGNEFPPHHASDAGDIAHRQKITRSRSRTVESFNGNREASMSCARSLNQNFAFEDKAPDFSMCDLHAPQHSCGIDTKARLTI